MGLFTRDCYDEDRDARIKEIGQEAYEKEQKEYARKYKEENPEKFRVSITEPIVRYRDVICIWDNESKNTKDEAFVAGIKENGDIIVRYIDNRNDGQLSIWKGEYKKLCSVIEE
jgi:hypothetical protein